MTSGISLIVGLGNPGQQYQNTRHNAGAWFLELLCNSHNVVMKPDLKLSGEVGRISIRNQDVRLLFPTTFMNHSGKAVAAISQYFKIAPENILVVYDELDLEPGTARLKQGGGHGGHNGIRDIISALGYKNFQRLRIGIGHPGASEKVLKHVLGDPSRNERSLIDDAITKAMTVLPEICDGKLQTAMNKLHTKEEKKSGAAKKAGAK